MTHKFRIKAVPYGYYVEKKFLFFWYKPALSISGWDEYSVELYPTYEKAKEVLEKQIMKAEKAIADKKYVDSFEVKYYYPPLADKEEDN